MICSFSRNYCDEKSSSRYPKIKAQHPSQDFYSILSSASLGNKLSRLSRISLAILLSLFLSACGGGGDGSTSGRLDHLYWVHHRANRSEIYDLRAILPVFPARRSVSRRSLM